MSRHVTRPGAGGGFTLVEVLVALAIVTVGMAALFTTTNQTVRTSSYLREKTLAQWIALNLITETRVSGEVPTDDQSEGDLEYAKARWRWELEKIPTPVEGIVRLEARVGLEDAPEDNWIGQATGFMGAAIAPPATPAPNWKGVQGGPGGTPGPAGQNGTPVEGDVSQPPPAPGEPQQEPGDPQQEPEQ